jgi:hypothetical protein
VSWKPHAFGGQRAAEFFAERKGWISRNRQLHLGGNLVARVSANVSA